MIGVVSMKRKILAFVTAVAVMCSGGMVVSADPQYDTNYDFEIDALGVGYDSKPIIHKIPGKTRAWLMQHSITGKSSSTITNAIVVTPTGVRLIPDTPMVKGTDICVGYYNSAYTGGTMLRVNGTYTAGYKITGTWNPNID